MKKIVSLVFGISLLFCQTTGAASLGFTDDAKIPSWAEEPIGDLMDQNIISGHDDGSFRPHEPLNRAEVAKIIVLASGADFDTSGGPHFPDVQPDDWFYEYVETMYNAGWINGYPSGKFRPYKTINRAEISKIIVSAFDIEIDLFGAPNFNDVEKNDWFYKFVETAYNIGIISGDGYRFRPEKPISRAETVQMVFEAMLITTDHVYIHEDGFNFVVNSQDLKNKTYKFRDNILLHSINIPPLPDNVEISAIEFNMKGINLITEAKDFWIELNGKKLAHQLKKGEINEYGQGYEIRFAHHILIQKETDSNIKFFVSLSKTPKEKIQLVFQSPSSFIVTALGIAGNFPIKGPEIKILEYNEKEYQCQKNGGLWQNFGPAQEPFCIMPTKDKGQKCMDSEQCEGICVAQLTPEAIKMMQKNQVLENIHGACSEFEQNFGCIWEVKKGRVNGMMCYN